MRKNPDITPRSLLCINIYRRYIYIYTHTGKSHHYRTISGRKKKRFNPSTHFGVTTESASSLSWLNRNPLTANECVLRDQFFYVGVPIYAVWRFWRDDFPIPPFRGLGVRESSSDRELFFLSIRNQRTRVRFSNTTPIQHAMIARVTIQSTKKFLPIIRKF